MFSIGTLCCIVRSKPWRAIPKAEYHAAGNYLIHAIWAFGRSPYFCGVKTGYMGMSHIKEYFVTIKLDAGRCYAWCSCTKIAALVLAFASMTWCTVVSAQVSARYGDGGRYSVSGVVVDSVSGKPLAGVWVTTTESGAQSGRDGRFAIDNVKSGRHRLMTMYFADYKMTVLDVEVSDSSLTGLVVKMKPELINMDEVVVTGTRTEKRLSDTPVLTTLIGQKEMRRSGSTSLTESLQDNIPGMVFSPNGMGNNMRIKGLSSRYVLFLVDGERMVSEGAGGNVNLDAIDVDNIEKIEVINGAASALYGSNAVGAVVNIITKRPVHKVEAGASASWESHNTWRTRAHVASSHKNVSVRASAFRNSSDGYDVGGIYAARYVDYGGDLRLGFKPAERFTIDGTARYFRHESFNPAGSMDATHPLTHTVAAALTGALASKNGRNSVRLSAGYDKYFDLDVLERKGGSTERDNTADYLSVRLVDTYKAAERWELVGGAEYNRESVFSKTSLGSVPVTKSVDDMNIFAQADYTPSDSWDVVLGGRYTHHSQFGGAFSPKLSVMYSVAGFRFRGGVGSAFRAPSIKELYYDFDHQGMFWVYGNPDLEAERGVYGSLSAEYARGVFNASVTGYYNRIGNKITQYDVINAQGGAEKYYRNVSSATLGGVDVSASYVVARQVTLKANYSFCDARDNSTGLQLDSNVRHSGTVSATWNGSVMRSPFSLQMAGRFNSPKLYQSRTEEGGEQVTVDERSKRYNIWKIVAVKPFRLRKHTLETTLKVDNLFGFRDKSFVSPGRTFMVGLRYGFK